MRAFALLKVGSGSDSVESFAATRLTRLGRVAARDIRKLRNSFRAGQAQLEFQKVPLSCLVAQTSVVDFSSFRSRQAKSRNSKGLAATLWSFKCYTQDLLCGSSDRGCKETLFRAPDRF